MSTMLVYVVCEKKQNIDEGMISQIKQLAIAADMYVFDPPGYIETFLKCARYKDYLIFDLADNSEYDNCEDIYSMKNPELQMRRREALVRIAENIVAAGYRMFLLTGVSGSADEEELIHKNVTISQLRNDLKEQFNDIHGLRSIKYVLTR